MIKKKNQNPMIKKDKENKMTWQEKKIAKEEKKWVLGLRV